MKIEEQVLSREQMAHLVELGVDISDASMCWIVDDSCINFIPDNNGESEVKWNVAIPSVFLLPYRPIPTYTIGDLIEKLPKHFYIEDSPLCMEAINGSGAFRVGYHNGQKGFKRDGNIKNALYKLLCQVAEKHKKLLEVKK